MIFDALVIGFMRRNGARAFVTVVAIALGVAVYLAVRLANAHTTAAFAMQTGVFGDDTDFDVVRPGGRLDAALLARIRALPTIASADPRLDGSAVARGELLRIDGYDLLAPLPRAFEFRAQLPGPFSPTGTGPTPYDLVERRGAIVSSAFALRRHLGLGDRLSVAVGRTHAVLRIAAVLPQDAAGLDEDAAVVDIATAQAFFGVSDTYDRIACTATPGGLSRARRSIASLLPPGAAIVGADERRDEVRRLVAGFTSNLAALGLLALAVATLLVYDAIAISVLQRRNDIGTLRAIGTTRGAIARTFIAEGLLLGCIGSLVGVGAGTLAASSAGATPMPNDLYAFDRIAPLIAFALGVALATGAAVAPAIEAARMQPTIALARRPIGEHPASPVKNALRFAACLAIGALGFYGAYRSGDERFTPLVCAAFVVAAASGVPLLLAAMRTLARASASRLSPPGYLASANLGSSPRRVATTLCALAISVALATAVAIFATSFRASLTRFADETIRGDIVATPFGGSAAPARAAFAPNEVARVAALSGIARLDATRTIAVPFHGASIDVRSSANGDAAGRADIDAGLATRAGLRSGDDVPFVAGGAERHVRVRSVVDGDPLGTGEIVLGRATFARAFDDTSADSLAIVAKPGVDLTRLRARIVAALRGRSVDVQTTRTIRAHLLERVDAVARATFVLAAMSGVIGALGIATALFALVLERRDEIWLVRYAGLSRAGAHAMVLYEAAALGAVGGIAGVVLGSVLACALLVLDRAVGWSVSPIEPLPIPIVALLGSIVVAVLAGILPARFAARLPMQRAAFTAVAFAFVATFCGMPAGASPHADAFLARDPASTRDVWRILGHLRAKDGSHIDIAVTFFRYVSPNDANVAPPLHFYAATFSILNEDERSNRTASRVDRDGSETAADGRVDLDVDGFRFRQTGGRMAREPVFTLHAADGTVHLDATMSARGELVELGPHGFVRTGSCASCRSRDVAYPQVAAHAAYDDGSRRYALDGTFWIEHESGGTRLAPNDRGWERFAIAFDDGRALVVRAVRGSSDDRSTIVDGAFVARTGHVTYLGPRDIDLTNPLGTTWRNARGIAYPSLWQIDVAALRLDCAIVPELQNQEADFSRGARYYQGSADVERAHPGPRDKGRAYVELTGFDGPFAF